MQQIDSAQSSAQGTPEVGGKGSDVFGRALWIILGCVERRAEIVHPTLEGLFWFLKFPSNNPILGEPGTLWCCFTSQC
jgi:hypothetical protein